MSSRDAAQEWFVPGLGINREVISSEIQRHLGNDATVRPGNGTGVNKVSDTAVICPQTVLTRDREFQDFGSRLTGISQQYEVAACSSSLHC